MKSNLLDFEIDKLTNSPYATRNYFGLCPLMSGKALPFRLSHLKS